MKNSILKEISKRAIHSIILLMVVGYLVILNTYGKRYALMGMILILLIFLILEYIRLELEIKMPFLDFLIRPKEIGRMYGAVYFITAAIICLAVFDFKIALASLLMGTFGDMAASVVGKKYGHMIIFKNKTLAGTIAGIIMNLIIGVVVLITYTNIYIILIMAFIAAIIEVLVDTLDDNLMVPLFTGFIGQILLMS